jgi:hypothetical protein
MLAWVEGTPDFKTPEGIARIDEVITCELPTDPDDHEFISKLQRHSHTHTCRKYVKDKDQNTPCRFAYPRQVSKVTKMVDPESSECIKNGGRICLLKRTPEEIFINNYNKEILQRWQGNMDIQVCGENEAIAEYLGKYVTKNESEGLGEEFRDALEKIRQEDSPINVKLMKQAMKIQKSRQVSAPEAAQRLIGLPFYTFS